MSLATALINLNSQASLLAETSNSISENGPKQVAALKSVMDSLTSKTVDAKVNVTVNVSGSETITPTTSTSVSLVSSAKGNYAYAKGTLMGELGPELVVSDGRYYTVGNNGAEFVDLPSDAIVFNHMQTKKLLSNGSIDSTGEPTISEKKSIAMATGNVSGPAHASMSEQISKLDQQIRMWEALAGMSAYDLGTKAGGGGGSKDAQGITGYIHDLERWYNLLRQIEKLEQQINYHQAARENMLSGYDHVGSLEKELRFLKKQQQAYKMLADLQKDYYDRRREDLLKTDYSKIFTYDEDGLMQYVDGKGYGLDILATLNATDEHGVAKMTAKQQVQYLKDNGFNLSQFMTKADGTKIAASDYTSILEEFWSGIDNWMSELDGLYDEYNDHLTSIEDNQQAQNEILQEYIDNQRSIEDKLLQAIEEREQAEIDKLQENLDALSNAASQYIEGLNDALQKEREMYSQNEEDAETVRLQRQLAILQRSGGSASEIKSLQDQLDSRLQESYFSEQERQIQAVQDASDAQIEKLQQQLDIMNEALEYQKENGLLWQEVSDMMYSWTPEAMMDFIERYTASYKSDSTLANQEASKETLKELEIWDAKRIADERNAMWKTYLGDAQGRYDEMTIYKGELAANEAYLTALKEGKAEGEAAAEADAVFNAINAEDARRAEEADALKNAQVNTGSSGSKGTTAKKQWQFTWDGSVKKGFGSKEAAEKAIQDLAKMEEDTLVSAYQAAGLAKETALAYARRSAGAQASFARQSIKQYKHGGLVDFTGPAWVDGTKSKPEAFLSAEDTALLKSKIFSNSDYSLKSAIEAIEALGRQFTSIDNSSIQEGITFENVTVQIQSGTISSDYDARRAGELALEEMMKIARRSSNIGVARR